MKIEDVELFYLAEPEVLDVADGSQDALLVRVRAGGHTGWGECEAAPLASIAAWCAPMSHAACKPVSASVLGERLDDPEDITRINRNVRANSLDLLQAAHTLSGVDTALWDLLGRARGEPVWAMLGYDTAVPRAPYASVLFGDTPRETLEKARAIRDAGYRAAKFGWGPFGQGALQADEDQVMAAREGVGEYCLLMVDAGTVFGDDVARARERLSILNQARVLWLEEPFVTGALQAYHALARDAGEVRLAGGEGCHEEHMARNMIDYAGLGFVQIDTGRIGGITAAKAVADYAWARGVPYINHTFTSYLALSASLQPAAGQDNASVCEYPVEARPLARAITAEPLLPDASGLLHLPERPGLGVRVDPDALQPYLVETEIVADGRVLYRTPRL